MGNARVYFVILQSPKGDPGRCRRQPRGSGRYREPAAASTPPRTASAGGNLRDVNKRVVIPNLCPTKDVSAAGSENTPASRKQGRKRPYRPGHRGALSAELCSIPVPSPASLAPRQHHLPSQDQRSSHPTCQCLLFKPSFFSCSVPKVFKSFASTFCIQHQQLFQPFLVV